MNETSTPARGLRAGDAVADVWDLVSIYDGGDRFLADLAAIPEAKRHLLVALWCDREIVNGGFLQLFWNSTGVLVPEAPAAYRALGLDDAATLFETVLGHFARPYPRDRGPRRQTFTLLPGRDYPLRGQFDSLDDAYYARLPKDEFGRVVDAYAERHVI